MTVTIERLRELVGQDAGYPCGDPVQAALRELLALREAGVAGMPTPAGHELVRRKFPTPFCRHGHAMTPANTYFKPNGNWLCRACTLDAHRRDAIKRVVYRQEYRQRAEVKKASAQREQTRYASPTERIKREARIALRRATVAGRVLRQPCVECGKPRAHGHHEDYSKPLDVIWLCTKHHAALHAKRRSNVG